MGCSQVSRKSHAPRSGFEPCDARPFKRHRPWCETVERFALANGIETDEHRLSQRQKQIAFGKNTIAYDRFIAACPRDQRKKGDPMTPLIRQKCSKRSFMGQVTSWKKKIYAYVAKLDEDVAANGGLLDNNEFRLDRGLTAGGTVEIGVGGVSAEGGSCGASPGRSTEAVTDDGEIDLSDLDDIELDDQGNVVTRHEDTASRELNDAAEKSNQSCPSIFMPFEE